MKYEKPSVAVLAAAEVIQGAGKGLGSQDVAQPTNPQPSISAYEADE